jgi:hypothetical protein
MKIHETTGPGAEREEVHLHFDGEVLSVSTREGRLVLPEGSLAAVMRRFGGELDPAERTTIVAELDLGPAGSLSHVRHLSGYDVVARDYLVYRPPHGEPLCALAITVAAALLHLGRAAAG